MRTKKQDEEQLHCGRVFQTKRDGAKMMDEQFIKLWREAVSKHDNDYLEDLINDKYHQIEMIQEFIKNNRTWK